MGRVSEEELERLKRDVSLERLAAAHGVVLRKHGEDLLGLCPFHDDRNPSLVITPSKNLWHCLGACQTGGSVIDWVMKVENVSFRHAVELLRSESGVMSPPTARGERGTKNVAVTAEASTETPPPAAPRKLPPLLTTDVADQTALNEVVGYYHATLRASTEALAYLEGRGLRHAEMIERFRLGFANRTLGYRLPAIHTAAGRTIRGQLQRLGILRESGHEHFWGSVVMPLVDARSGAITGMYGRKIGAHLGAEVPRHMYLPGPRRGVFNAKAFAAEKTIILCEALLDGLTFWANGFRNVTSAYGVEGFTEELCGLFGEHGTKTCLIAFDRDEAGDKGAEKAAARLAAQGVTSYRVQFPRGMDANEYARKMSPAGKALELVLRNATWMCGPRAVRGDEGGGDSARGIAPSLVATDNAAAAAAEELEPESSVGAEPAPLRLSRETSVPEPAPEPEERAPAARAEAGAAPVLRTTGTSPSSPAPAPAGPPSPAAAAPEPVEVKPDELTYVFGDRRYRVRGLGRNATHDALKVNILASRGERFHLDHLDLYAARARATLVKQVAEELGVEEAVVKTDVGRLLLGLEQQQAVAEAAAKPATAAPSMTDAERDEALAYLRDPRLLERLLEDFRRCGVVGEETNKLVGYLAAMSRKLGEPLAVVLQSSSAAGKSSLMDAILAFVPEEDRVKYAAMTGQSLFYMGETNLQHKILAIVEEEGASRASYALKILQSEGELTIASTGKDPESGKLVTHEYHVQGPVMIFLTTTAVDIDEELLNRCLVLTVDEERGQTEAIHELQRQARSLEGRLMKVAREGVLALHRRMQRLIEPVLVVNPFYERLTFPSHRTRTRRDHMKYLTLIETVALLHQHQRARKVAEVDGREVTYIEVAVEDIAVANRLAHQVLGRSLDELAPQTRRLLTLLDAYVGAQCAAQAIVRKDYRFTRRQVREATGFGETQLHVHLQRLVEMEYVVVHRGQNGQSFVYELAYEPGESTGVPHLPGLVDVATLGGSRTSSTFRGDGVSFRGAFGPDPGGIRPPFGWPSGSESLGKMAAEVTFVADEAENAHKGRNGVGSLYVPSDVIAGGGASEVA